MDGPEHSPESPRGCLNTPKEGVASPASAGLFFPAADIRCSTATLWWQALAAGGTAPLRRNWPSAEDKDPSFRNTLGPASAGPFFLEPLLAPGIVPLRKQFPRKRASTRLHDDI